MSNAIAIVKHTFGIDKVIEAFGCEQKINREMAFAIQALEANSFLAGVAERNPGSLMKAIMNIALTGISLNPVQKFAYLVPRGGSVCLDFSYRGLSQLAIDAGSVLDINTQIVYERDFFEYNQGTTPTIVHRPAWGDRGQIEGVYSAALLAGGTYHIESMSLKEIEAIKRRAPSGNKGPWVTDFGEMARKTVIKRLFKYLPIPSEVMAAVQIDHETNPALAVDVEQNGLDLGEDLILEG